MKTEMESVIADIRAVAISCKDGPESVRYQWANRLAAAMQGGGCTAADREDLCDTANNAFNDAYDGAPDGGGVRSALRHVVDCVLAEIPPAAPEAT